MDFLNASFRIARVFEINIRIHILFVIFMGWQLFTAKSDWLSVLALLLLLFGIVLLHEFGHCFGARAVGGYAENILMWPLGGLAYAHAPRRPWPQFVTVAAGPLVNVIFCVGSAVALLIAGRVYGFEATDLLLLNPYGGLMLTNGYSWIELTWLFYQINLFLLAFNLLPIYPMDGGQLLHTILWPFLGLQRATIIAAQLGLAGAIGLGIWGFSKGGGSMLTFIAIFGAFTCWQQLQAARAGLLVEDSRFEVYHGPSYDPRPWWQRIFRVGRHRPRPTPSARPVVPAVDDDEAELDRLLQKVSARGLDSLSYVERQRLEQITRRRQATEHSGQRNL